MKNLNGLLAVLAIFLCASISYGQYNPNFELRINAGGPEVSLAGKTFIADDYHVGGAISNPATVSNILPAPHNLERYGNTGSMSYKIPLADGFYKVILSFKEVHWTNPLKRVFDVKIEDNLELEEFDPFVVTGGKEILEQRSFNVQVSDGELTIDFSKNNISTNAYNHPQVTAIEILGSNFITDTTGPIAPSSITAGVPNTTSVPLSWAASTDPSGIKEYHIYMDANNDNNYQFKTTSSGAGLTTTVTGLTPNTNYKFKVKAVDNSPAVNEGDLSTVFASVTTASDGAPGDYDPNFELRINAGGPAVTTIAGETFIADDYHFGGATTNPATASNILPAPHNLERYGSNGSMSYKIPLADGLYKVKLSFKEVYWTVPLKRVFNVNIEGLLKLEEFDVFVAAGGKEILVQRSFDVTISDGELTIDFTASDSYPSHHPEITAIEISSIDTVDPETPNPGSSLWSQSTVNPSDIFYTTGNVGIGTNAILNYKLAVDGKIRAREVKVDNDTWADYVFFKNYKLPTLEEVEKHIQDKGHLINIPSAAEVEANGIELGEMNKLLLEKIEELTLYVIQQEKRIKSLEKKK